MLVRLPFLLVTFQSQLLDSRHSAWGSGSVDAWIAPHVRCHMLDHISVLGDANELMNHNESMKCDSDIGDE